MKPETEASQLLNDPLYVGMVYQAPQIRVATAFDVASGAVDIAIGFADLWLLSDAELNARIAAFDSDTVH